MVESCLRRGKTVLYVTFFTFLNRSICKLNFNDRLKYNTHNAEQLILVCSSKQFGAMPKQDRRRDKSQRELVQSSSTFNYTN